MRTRLLARLPGATTFRWLVAAAIALPVAILALVSLDGRQDALRLAERDVAQKIDILHEHAAKLFETQQLVLGQVDALIRGMGWDEIAGSEELHAELVRAAEALGQVDAIWLADSDGTVLAGSHSFPLEPFSITDRDYWQALRDGQPAPYISRAYPGRITSRFRFNIAMRRTPPGGGDVFDGVLAVSVAPTYLEQFYARVSSEPGFSVGLVRADGHMVVRFPSLGEPPPVPNPASPIIAALSAGADRGLFWARSEFEGVEKLYGWRRVSGFPVSVVFAIPESTALAPWREALIRNVWITAAAIAVLIAVILGVYRLRQLELEVLADRFQTVQQLSLDGFTLLTAVRGPDGRIVDFIWDYANPVAVRHLQAVGKGLTGRRLLEHLPATAGPGGLMERYARVVETGEPHDIEVSFAGDGIAGWFRNSAIKFGDGVAVQCSDMTERRQVQEGMRAALAERDRLLEQKELLIKEVNHRVKNSLQLVSGMLSLDALTATDPAVRRRMEEAVGRVRAIAAVHERLYRSDDVQRVEVAVFLRELCGHLARQLGLPVENLQVDADDTTVLTDRAPPLALLTNELVTNALKHGRAERGEMRVEITFRRNDGHFRLEVRDYGPGLPPDFDPSKTKGLGMRIAQGLAAQLDGRVVFEAASPGTRVVIIGALEELSASEAA